MRNAKKKCHVCGEMTDKPVAIWYQAAIGPGVPAKGAKVIDAWACKSCASLLSDDTDEDDDDDY